MRRRLAALLLAVVALFGAVSAGDMALAPQAAAAPADGGPISVGVQALCAPTVIGLVGAISGHNICKKTGDEVENKVKKEWNDIWNSLLGDFLKSAEDVAKWLIREVFTLALTVPSLKLQDTGLFGANAALAGMMVWLGWVIAAFGLMWQVGKMALTGQMKYAGQAMVGWVQNALLTGIGLTIVATLLALGDTMTNSLVNSTFGSGDAAYKRAVDLMMPAGIENPVIVSGVVAVLFLVGGLQLVMVFLRQAAIPIQCLVLPIAGAGRVGGDSTRQWAPRLITSILTAITYKPLLAIILCAGFEEFDKGHGLVDWLRGLATLVLGTLAPAALMKVFAPIGAEVGGGLSASGAIGAAASVGQLIEARRGNRGGGKPGGGKSESGGAQPDSAVDQAKRLSQTMPKSYQSGGAGKDGQGGGQDALAQAARNQLAKVPNPASSPDSEVNPASNGKGTGVTGGKGKSGAAGMAGPVLQVLDGVNDTVQQAGNQIGDGGKNT